MMPMPEVVHRYARTPDGDLHYVEAGTGEPVLLIHGGHGAWVHWLANIGALAQHRRVLAIDMPGFGHSYVPGGQPDLAGYAALVVRFIESLDLQNVALAGFSFGTLVAATTSTMLPQTVTSLTLINPPGIGDRTPQALALPDRLAAFAREHGLRAGVGATLRELMLNDHSLINDALTDLIADCVERTRFKTRYLSRQTQMLPVLEQVSQPVRVFLGACDPYHSHELDGRRERINRALGRESVTIVEHAAHWLQYDQPDQFNRAFLRFLAAQTN